MFRLVESRCGIQALADEPQNCRLYLECKLEDPVGLPRRLAEATRAVFDGPMRAVVDRWQADCEHLGKAHKLDTQADLALREAGVLRERAAVLERSIESGLCDGVDVRPLERELATALAEAAVVTKRAVVLRRLAEQTRGSARTDLRSALEAKRKELLAVQQQEHAKAKAALERAIAAAYAPANVAEFAIKALSAAPNTPYAQDSSAPVVEEYLAEAAQQFGAAPALSDDEDE